MTQLLARRQFGSSLASAGLVFFGISNKAFANPLSGYDLVVWAAEKLLDQATTYAGGAAMASAFHETSIEDAKAWIDDGVKTIEGSIAGLNARIQADLLNQMRADLDTVKSQLHEYAALSEQSRARSKPTLDNCDFCAGRLLSLSLNYPQAFWISVAATAYKLSSRFALFQFDSDKGHIYSLYSNKEMSSTAATLAATKSSLVRGSSARRKFEIRCAQDHVRLNGANTHCELFEGDQHVASTGEMDFGWLSGNEKIGPQSEEESYKRFSSQLVKNRNDCVRSSNQYDRALHVLFDECWRKMLFSSCAINDRSRFEFAFEPAECRERPQVKWE